VKAYKLEAESSKLPGETPVFVREPCGLFHGVNIAQR